MPTLLIAVGAGLGFILAYHTYGRWLGKRIFDISADRLCPSYRLRDDKDYVPTRRAVVFGHHFTSIAATGPIVGPAIAVMWGWLPALLWVLLGSIFIGAVHDFGSLVVSLRNNGQTVGDIAGRVLNRRVRVLFLCVLFLALTIIIAIFGLVIAVVFRQFPSAIFPCLVQIPLAIGIGIWLHRKGVSLIVPSLLALGVMYLTVILGDTNFETQNPLLLGIMTPLHAFNATLAGWPIIVWVGVLLVYSYIASVLPVWILLQPRDYINSLQLVGTLALIVVGLIVAALVGGAPPVEGAARQPLEIAAPVVNWHPEGAPLLMPFLFITVACGAISGFHCLVSSGTSSKQLERETDAQFVGYGAMMTEAFLAVIVILACVAGLGLGVPLASIAPSGGLGRTIQLSSTQRSSTAAAPAPAPNPQAAVSPAPADISNTNLQIDGLRIDSSFIEVHELKVEGLPGITARGRVDLDAALASFEIEKPGAWTVAYTDVSLPAVRDVMLTGRPAFDMRYISWGQAGGLARTVGAFVDGAGNFLKAMGIPGAMAVALIGVLVASFAATTLDTATRLQRYVVQELAAAILPQRGKNDCIACGYDLSMNVSGSCPECGAIIDRGATGSLPASAAADGESTGSRTGGQAASGTRRTATAGRGFMNPLVWLTNKYFATLFAVITAGAMASLPAPGAAWSLKSAGGGGMILWPMFGATNQLLGGLAFLVIAFWLWRRKKPIFFLVIPLIFMLIMPAWAMLYQVFIGNPGGEPGWVFADRPNWVLIGIALMTVALEAWMIVEAVLMWPKVKGLLEEDALDAEPVPASVGS